MHKRGLKPLLHLLWTVSVGAAPADSQRPSSLLWPQLIFEICEEQGIESVYTSEDTPPSFEEKLERDVLEIIIDSERSLPTPEP